MSAGMGGTTSENVTTCERIWAFCLVNCSNRIGIVRSLFLLFVIISLGTSIASIPGPDSIFRKHPQTKSRIWKFEALSVLDAISVLILSSFLCCIPVGTHDAGFKLKLLDSCITLFLSGTLAYFGIESARATDSWENIFCGNRPEVEEGNKGEKLSCLFPSDLTPWESCICDIMSTTNPAIYAGVFAILGAFTGIICIFYIWKGRTPPDMNHHHRNTPE